MWGQARLRQRWAVFRMWRACGSAIKIHFKCMLCGRFLQVERKTAAPLIPGARLKRGVLIKIKALLALSRLVCKH